MTLLSTTLLAETEMEATSDSERKQTFYEYLLSK